MHPLQEGQRERHCCRPLPRLCPRRISRCAACHNQGQEMRCFALIRTKYTMLRFAGPLATGVPPSLAASALGACEAERKAMVRIAATDKIAVGIYTDSVSVLQGAQQGHGLP
jgi:hypothetical protein